MNKIRLIRFSVSILLLSISLSCGRSVNNKTNKQNLPTFPQISDGSFSEKNRSNKIVTSSPRENLSPQITKDLNILTFNTWGVLRYVTKELDKRVRLITTAIDGYDLVNLQETTVSETKAITEKNTYYPHKVRYDNTSFLKWGSGLSTLSKYPIIEKKFLKFSSCAALDCNNNKGVLFMRIEVPELGLVDIYNTHYQSMPISTKIRLEANKDFEKFYKENTQGNLEIITGDFNFAEKDEDYKDFVKRFNVVDTFRQKKPEDPGFTYDKTKNSNAFKLAEPQRIDFIFLIPNKKYQVEVIDSKVVFTEQQENLFLSDHFGLNTTLRITKTPALKNGF